MNDNQKTKWAYVLFEIDVGGHQEVDPSVAHGWLFCEKNYIATHPALLGFPGFFSTWWDQDGVHLYSNALEYSSLTGMSGVPTRQITLPKHFTFGFDDHDKLLPAIRLAFSLSEVSDRE